MGHIFTPAFPNARLSRIAAASGAFSCAQSLNSICLIEVCGWCHPFSIPVLSITGAKQRGAFDVASDLCVTRRVRA